ncbi:MAG: DegV family protein, partial [Chloroflexi bacterium]|nr:DegV family protein [Chloroflexota bacterium]
MSAVSIVTDSTADLGSVQAAELGVTIVPLVVQFGHRSYRDGLDLSPTEFFQMLRQSPTLPTTSQPSAAAFEAAYR